MFANPKKAAAEPKAKGRAKKEKPSVPVAGLAELAALMQLKASIETMISTADESVRAAALDILINDGIKAGKRPASIYVSDEGEGFSATGNAQLRKRSSASVLTEEQAEVLDANNIPYEHTVKVPAMLAVNPAYASDQALLGKIDKAIAKVPGLPEDFIVQTEEVGADIATEESMDAVFKLAVPGVLDNKELISELLEIVATPSFGRVSVTDEDAALKSVESIIATKVFKRIPPRATKKAA